MLGPQTLLVMPSIPARYFSSLARRDLDLFPEGELRLSRGTADSLLMWVKGNQSCRTPSAVVSLALVLLAVFPHGRS